MIFNDDEPFDLSQGGLGDCWLIASIAALGDYPAYIKEEKCCGMLWNILRFEIQFQSFFLQQWYALKEDQQVLDLGRPERGNVLVSGGFLRC